MTVIDLAAVRDKLAAAHRLAEATATRLAELLVSESIRQAERACAVAAPIAAADEPMSRIIHRGVVRRLRADVRKAFGGLGAETRQWALEKAVEIYRGRTIVILDERDAAAKSAREAGILSRPTLAAFMERAGLWVSGAIPADVRPWVLEFLKDYQAAVEVFASMPRHVSHEAAVNKEAAIDEEFNLLMAPYRDDPRRPYIGAVFDALLRQSIRGAFHEHVDALALRYAGGLRA